MAVSFMNLTRPKMRKLNPNEKIEEHGITYQKLPNNDGRFTVNIMVDGQRIHRVIGKESDGVTREKAEEFICNARADARAGRLNLPKGRKVSLSFREAAKQYLQKLEEEGGKDLKAKGRRLAQHLVPYFGNIPLSKIETSDINRYKEHRSNEVAVPGGAKNKPNDLSKCKNTSNGTINRELAVLSHLFSQAVEWKWIHYKPAKIALLKEEPGRNVYLTREQITRLKKVAREDQNPYILLFLAIGLDTSMRKMEILSIRTEHIDVERRLIYIPASKTGWREQPITRRLAAHLKRELERLQPEQEWLFQSRKSATGHSTNIDKAFRRVVTTAGLDPREVVRHTMRHTVITHLVQDRVDLPTVMRISGHKTLAMVQRYSHQNGDHIREAMDRLEKRLEAAA